MTVLVDELADYAHINLKPFVRAHGTRWCHLVSDESLEELHEFAAKIGLKRGWFQGDHYDLTPGMRAKAVRRGAVEVTARELVKRRRKSER